MPDDIKDLETAHTYITSIIGVKYCSVVQMEAAYSDVTSLDAGWESGVLNWARMPSGSTDTRTNFDAEIGSSFYDSLVNILQSVAGEEVYNPYNLDLTKPIYRFYTPFFNRLMRLCKYVESKYGYTLEKDYFIQSGVRPGSGTANCSKHLWGCAVDFHYMIDGKKITDKSGGQWVKRLGVAIPQWPIIEALGDNAANFDLTWLGKGKLTMLSGGIAGNDHEHFDFRNYSKYGIKTITAKIDNDKTGVHSCPVPYDYKTNIVTNGSAVATTFDLATAQTIANHILDDLYNGLPGLIERGIGNASTLTDTTISPGDSSDPLTLMDYILPEILKNMIDYEFLVRRFGQRTGQISMPFSPHLVAGFPMNITDTYGSSKSEKIKGFITGITHSLDANSPQAMTTVEVNMLRTEEEEQGLANSMFKDIFIGDGEIEKLYDRLGIDSKSREIASMEDVINFLKLNSPEYAVLAKDVDSSGNYTSKVSLVNSTDATPDVQKKILEEMSTRKSKAKKYNKASEKTGHAMFDDTK